MVKNSYRGPLPVVEEFGIQLSAKWGDWKVHIAGERKMNQDSGEEENGCNSEENDNSRE
jgi:hypothetical protein